MRSRSCQISYSNTNKYLSLNHLLSFSSSSIDTIYRCLLHSPSFELAFEILVCFELITKRTSVIVKIISTILDIKQLTSLMFCYYCCSLLNLLAIVDAVWSFSSLRLSMSPALDLLSLFAVLNLMKRTRGELLHTHIIPNDNMTLYSLYLTLYFYYVSFTILQV